MTPLAVPGLIVSVMCIVASLVCLAFELRKPVAEQPTRAVAWALGFLAVGWLVLLPAVFAPDEALL